MCCIRNRGILTFASSFLVTHCLIWFSRCWVYNSYFVYNDIHEEYFWEFTFVRARRVYEKKGVDAKYAEGGYEVDRS